MWAKWSLSYAQRWSPSRSFWEAATLRSSRSCLPEPFEGTTRMHLREVSGCGAKVNESRNDFETESKSQSELDHRVRHDPEQPSRARTTQPLYRFRVRAAFVMPGNATPNSH